MRLRWFKRQGRQSGPKTVDEILGTIERGIPATPGTRGDEAKVRYVSFTEGEVPSKLFDEVVRKIDPPIVSSGGASLPNMVVTTPDGVSYFAVETNGDPIAWQSQIEEGALALGRLTAKISGSDFEIADGRKFPLSDCLIEQRHLAR